ncbi:MAG: ATPase domain-containing protein, partial [Vulcanimicrobiaceae bacterium]
MAKSRSIFFCSGCGHESPRWLGRCPQCEAWNSFDERPFAVPAASRAVRSAAARRSTPAPVALREIARERVPRIATGGREFDAVLGGGIVPGSVTLVGGPPGAGKSTLVLQVAATLAREGSSVIYVCGE